MKLFVRPNWCKNYDY